jgi:5-methylcytosine-specific restriction protein A
MTPKRRLRLWLAHDGRCALCRVKVPLKGTVMDHAIQLWLESEGREDDANLRPLCPDCDKPKTAKDAAIRAKVKRIRIKHGLEPRKAKPSRPIQSRGFDKTKSRKFNGEVTTR